ncbi:hypothetical protein BDY19DRAFT_1010104, partial [Irpex rosettiformis]
MRAVQAVYLWSLLRPFHWSGLYIVDKPWLSADCVVLPRFRTVCRRVVCLSPPGDLPTSTTSEQGIICVRIPLHAVVAFVPVTCRAQIEQLLPPSMTYIPLSIADLRICSCDRCCLGSCIFVYAVFRLPIYSAVTHTLSPAPPAAPGLPPPRIPVPLREDGCSAGFPPAPLSLDERAAIVNGWCDSVSGHALHEGVCASCACLFPETQLKCIPTTSSVLQSLCPSSAHASRGPLAVLSQTEPLLCPSGVRSSNSGVNEALICSSCMSSLSKRRIPPLSLRNSRWLGEVPSCLHDLSFMEKILVSRYRHNRCIVRVDIHAPYKMRANAIVFSQPVAQLLPVLPMPRAELDHIVAVLFTGSVSPSASDFKRTPVFVRPSKIWTALLWLKENHPSYGDVLLSSQNLAAYSEDNIPVTFFHQLTPEGDPINTLGVSDSTAASGTESDICPLSVHGVTEEDIVSMSFNEQALRAIHHLRMGGNILTVGSSSSPESIYNNPDLFPGLFPWLYPYGVGGPETVREVDIPRVRYFRACLLYYDRRFQEDAYFPFIVLNQAQIRESSVGGYILTERRNFDKVADRLLSTDPEVLT